MTASLGSLLHCPTILSVKNLFLMSYLNFPWCSFIPFPHVLPLVTRERRSPTPAPLPLLEEVVDCDEVTPQPSLLQAEKSK